MLDINLRFTIILFYIYHNHIELKITIYVGYARTFLDNKALERLVRSHLTKKETNRIENLHFKRQSDGLEEAETKELAELMKKMERWFVLRNEASDLLLERGQSRLASSQL